MAHFARVSGKWSLPVVLLAAGVLAFAAWRLHSIDRRARAEIEQLLAEASGVHARVAGAEIDLRGFRLLAHGIDLDDGERNLLKRAELSGRLSWRALLHGRLQLDSLEFQAESLRLNRRDLERAWQRGLGTSAFDRLDLRVDRVEVALADRFEWRLEHARLGLDARRFQLQAERSVWLEQGRERAHARLRARGELRDRAGANGELQLSQVQLGDRSLDEPIEAQLARDGRRLKISGSYAFGRSSGAGALAYVIEGELGSRFALRVQSQRMPLARALAWLGAQTLALDGEVDGELELSGTLEPLELVGRLRLAGRALEISDMLLRIPQLTAASTIRIDRAGARFDALSLSLPKGTLSGHAAISDSAVLELALNGDDVSLADFERVAGLAATGHGRIAIQASGPIASPDLHAELALSQAQLAGIDLGQLTTSFDLREGGRSLQLIHAEISDPQRRLAVDELPLRFDAGLVDARARVKVARLPLAELYRVLGAGDDPLLQRLQADTAGEVTVNYHRSATDHPLELELSLRLSEVALGSYRFEQGQLKATVEMPLRGGGLGSGVLKLEQLALAADGGRLELSGELRRGALAMRVGVQRLPLQRDAWLHAHLSALGGRIDGSGTLSGDATSTQADLALSIDDLKLSDAALGRLTLHAALRDRPQLMAAGDGCTSAALASGPTWLVCGSGVRDQLKVDLAIGSGAGHPVRGRIDLHDFALAAFLPASEADARIAGTLSGALTIDAGGLDDLDALSGHFEVRRLEIADGDGALANEAPFTLEIASGKLSLEDAALRGPKQHYQLRASGVLGRDARLIADGSFAASLLTRRSQPLVEAYGEVGVHLEWQPGSSAKEALSGRAELEKVQLRVGASTLLREIAGALELNGERLHVASLRAALGGGELQLEGQLVLSGLRVASYRLSLTAATVALEPQPHVELVLDADTQLEWSGGDALPRLTGDVRLKRGLYGRQIGLEAISALGREHAERPTRERVAIDLRLHQDQALRVRNDFLDGELVMSGPDRTLHLVGSDRQLGMLGQLSIPRGRLLFYGDQFHVTRGEISFDDRQRIAPSFDLRAVADQPKRPDTSIVLQAHGTREAFDVALRCDSKAASEPPPFTCNYARDHMRCDTFEQLVALWVCRSKPTISRADHPNDAKK